MTQLYRTFLEDRGPEAFQASFEIDAQPRLILGGLDWGGNASCVTAALWPERIGGFVSYAGYDVIDVSRQRYSVAPSAGSSALRRAILRCNRSKTIWRRSPR
jgi:hypothetical protein